MKLPGLFSGIDPNRKHGQNFLVHAATAERFVESAGEWKEHLAVEIGPGLGAITAQLCKRFSKVVAVEKDRRIIKAWNELTNRPENLTLVEGDATQFDFAQLAASHGLKQRRLVVFGNLPFNVSTVILIHLLKNWSHVAYAHLTFQKEVADRLLAKPSSKAYGSLTIQTQLYSEVEKRLFLGKGQYFPIPKVDSQVVGLKFFEQPQVTQEHIADFESMVRQVFLFRRKTLANGLKASKRFKSWGPLVELYAQKAQIPLRAEALSWDELYDFYLFCLREEK